jgi:hypothetical protein
MIISIALYIAVNAPVIDWPFAEAVLERYLFLGTEESGTSVNMFLDNGFGEAVWEGNCFKSNLVKLLGGGSDCWRVRKSLELLLIMVGDTCNLSVSVEIFSVLGHIVLKSIRSYRMRADDTKWAFLIAKNQEITVDHGILRLINSYLYSRKAKNTIAYNILKMISAFIAFNPPTVSPEDNVVSLSKAVMIDSALVNILKDENYDYDVTKICLDVLYTLVSHINHHMEKKKVICGSFVAFGICEALMLHVGDFEQEVLDIVFYIALYDDIPTLIAAGLVNALYEVYEYSPEDFFHDQLVKLLCEYDDGITHQFLELGVPEGSNFFGIEQL